MVEIDKKNECGGSKVSKEIVKKKRGRRRKGEVVAYKIDKEKMKYVADFSSENEALAKLWKVLEKANDHEFGSEITFMHVIKYLLSKVNDKGIAELQESSLSEKDRVLKHFKSTKASKNADADLWGYLAKELKLK